MESALGWIGELMSTLGALIPTWHHVECVDAAVSISRGDRVQSLGPGITWYWPFWTELYTRPSRRQTASCETNLTTQDGHAVTAAVMVRYQIEDSIAALVETHDVDQAIEDETLAVLCQFITTQSLDDINEDRQKVNTQLTLKVRSALKPYGVAVERAQLTAFAKGRLLIHAGWTVSGAVEEE